MADETKKQGQEQSLGSPSGAHGATTTGAFGDTEDLPPDAAKAGPDTLETPINQGPERVEPGSTSGKGPDQPKSSG